MAWWMIVAVMLIALASVVLLIYAQHHSHHADHAAQRRFYELLQRNSDDAMDRGWIRGVVGRMARGNLARWLPKFEHPETVQLLRQCGWYTTLGRLIFHISRWLVPILLTLMTVVYLLLNGDPVNLDFWAKAFMAGAIGFFIPKRVIMRKAKNRRDALSREMPTAIHLLRMLFDAGLSTEHALRVLHREGHVLTPELSGELTAAFRQIDAGLDPADALAEMAAPLEVNELDDLVAILKQVSRHGGNIRETLVKFAQLMEDRQLSALREYVNVLSGKMSVVMMVFLFPALLIFLAGPGFMSLAKGLGGAF